MTYIVKYLPNIKDLKEEFESYPDNIKYYLKYEGFTGSSESINFLEQKIKEHIKNKKNESTKN